MGCCVSTEENRATLKQSSSLQQKKPQFEPISKSPPRPEEESVKEVLSETPKPKPKPEPKPEPMFKITKTENPKAEEDEDEDDEEEKPRNLQPVSTPKKPILEQKLPIKEPKYPDQKAIDQGNCFTPEEISDVSEMCSLSESISTTTLREREDEEELCSNEVRQRVYRSQGYNSHSTNRNNNRSFSGGGRGSPMRRRSDPSPPRFRNPGPVQNRSGPRRVGPGENSGRRSRSPATRSNVGRSPSGRKTGPSPGRVRAGQTGPENGRKVEEEEEEEKSERRESEWQGPNESLENPLVSLECFIFL